MGGSFCLLNAGMCMFCLVIVCVRFLFVLLKMENKGKI